MMNHTVCILGASLNTGNMGVSALAASLIKLIVEVQPAAAIFFFIGSRNSDPQTLTIDGRPIDIQIINYRMSPKAELKEHLVWLFLMAVLYRIIPFATWKEAILKGNQRLSMIKKADFVGNICGGDSFSDIYGQRRFIVEAVCSLIVILLGNRLHLLPQTFGPYKSKLSQYMAKVIMTKASTIVARDRESVSVVQRILGPASVNKTVIFCPDVAFALKANEPDTKAIYPTFASNGVPNVVGLNINGLMYNGGYTRENMFGLALDYRRFVHRITETMLDKTDCTILLVPHTFAPDGNVQSDPQACMEVFRALQKYKGRIHILEGTHDQHALKGVIGLCTFFIGSRMHSCIAALSQGIPTVAVAYSKKFIGVFDSVGMGNMIVDARDTSLELAEDKILHLYKERANIRQVLNSRVESLRSLLSDTFKAMLLEACVTDNCIKDTVAD